ncbi:MAG: trigger factor [Roseburia sp.]|nr:trigger factor [Roseburia sp.]
MKSTFEKKESQAIFKISLDNAEWESELENAYNRTKKRYKIPGFRPGKASRRMIEMHYGQGVFFDAAVDFCINRAYSEELSKHPELETFGSPDVSFEKPEDGAAFAFSITVTLYPEVKLGDYKGIKLPKIEYNVSDEDVAARIDAELHRASRLVKTDKAAENGDVTVIDYVGTVDGKEFAGGKAENHELKLGSNAFIPGFEDGLIGAVAGEERDVKVKFPDEYHAEELKGKDAVFHVKVNEVRVEEVPELNDEFVKEHSKYETVDEYKKGLVEDMQKAAKSRERNERIDAVMKAVADNAECKVPEKIVNAEVDRMYAEFEHQMSHYGIKPEDYLKYSNSSVAQFRADRREPAERNVKIRQVMRAIIEAEKLSVSEDEIAEKLKDDSVRHELEHEVGHRGGSVEEFAANEILTDKFFDLLLTSNEFVLDKDDANKQEPAAKPAAKKPAAKKPAAAKSADKEPAEKKEPAAKKPAAKKPTAKKPEAAE